MSKAKLTIRVRDFIEDIRWGMDDGNLIAKYGLTPKLLSKIFEKLIDAGLITEAELMDRAGLTDTQVTKAFLAAQSAMDELD